MWSVTWECQLAHDMTPESTVFLGPTPRTSHRQCIMERACHPESDTVYFGHDSEDYPSASGSNHGVNDPYTHAGRGNRAIEDTPGHWRDGEPLAEVVQ